MPTSASKEENMRKFASFEDQLKQIRMSEDYLQNNPDVAEQVQMNEAKARSRAEAASASVFQIGEDDSDEEEKTDQLLDPDQVVSKQKLKQAAKDRKEK